MEPKEHHQKTRLTKNEKMTIALAKVMARSTTDLGDKLLERWLELRRCFRLELADAIVYKTTTAFVDFNFTFLFTNVGT